MLFRSVVRWRHRQTLYEITVENPGRRNRGVAEVQLDGARVDPRAIPLVDDGGAHYVRVMMGDPAPETAPVPATESKISLGTLRKS